MRSSRRRWVLVWCWAAVFSGVLAGVLPAQEARVPARATPSGVFPTAGEVVGDSVSIRARNSLNATRLAFAFKGDKLRVLGASGDWYTIDLPRDYTMWVSKEYVTVGANKEGVVTGDNVRARAGAGLQYQMVGHLDRGRRIEIIGEKPGWLQFRFATGDRAYISRQYVRLAGEAYPRPVEPEGHGVEPPPPPPVEVQSEVEQKIMDSFNKAEEIYRREVRKERIVEWDLEEAHTLYVGVLEKTRNKNLIKKCRSRCAVIALARRYREASERASDPRKRLEKREKEIEEEYERKRKMLAEEIQGLFPTAVAVGRLRKLASPWLRPATHKLISEGRVTHILHSEVVDLTLYEGKLVGIEGEVDDSIKWPVPALKVTGIALPPAKSEPTEGEKPEPEKSSEEKGGEEEAPAAPG